MRIGSILTLHRRRLLRRGNADSNCEAPGSHGCCLPCVVFPQVSLAVADFSSFQQFSLRPQPILLRISILTSALSPENTCELLNLLARRLRSLRYFSSFFFLCSSPAWLRCRLGLLYFHRFPQIACWFCRVLLTRDHTPHPVTVQSTMRHGITIVYLEGMAPTSRLEWLTRNFPSFAADA